MRKKLLVAALGLSAFVFLAGFGCSHHRGSMDPEKIRKFAAWRMDDFLDDLDATDAQRASVKLVQARVLDRGLLLFAEHRATKRQLVTQWDAAKPDGQAVHALVQKQAEGLTAFAHDLADAALQLHGILDARQRAEVSEELHERLGEK